MIHACLPIVRSQTVLSMWSKITTGRTRCLREHDSEKWGTAGKFVVWATLSISVIGYRCSWADFVRQLWQQSCVIHQCNSLLQSPPLQPWRHSVQYFPLIKKSSLAFQVPLWQVLQFSNKLQPQKETKRRKAERKYNNMVVASQEYVVFMMSNV